MRSDWTSVISRDAKRSVQVFRHPSATWPQVIRGTASDGVDLSAQVTTCRLRSSELALGLAFRDELYGGGTPRPGEPCSVKLDGRTLWNGVIGAVNDYREERGSRTMSVTARSRDASPLWRELRWSTRVYPVGTDLTSITRDVLRALGLGSTERLLDPSGVTTRHTQTQIADLPAWQMLEAVLLPLGQMPWVNALGQFKPVRRDVTRRRDLILTQEQVLRIRGSRARMPVNAVILKWLDAKLSKSLQQDQVLGKESLTAGFFKLEQERNVYFSQDRRQRAQETYLRVLQSINDGLLPVGDEEYVQLDEFHGLITVTTDAWVPALATAALIAMLASSAIPDIAPPFGGPTIPVGKIVHGIAEVAILLVMMSLGTGAYEVWGQPYDFVHAINTTEAYNKNAPAWLKNEKEIQNDFIVSQSHARGVAVRELLYENLSAQSWGVDIVDTPAIEIGDILKFPDGSRLYVTDYTRDLTRDAPAVLSIEGFRC
jgi:hypothetical protein